MVPTRPQAFIGTRSSDRTRRTSTKGSIDRDQQHFLLSRLGYGGHDSREWCEVDQGLRIDRPLTEMKFDAEADP